MKVIYQGLKDGYHLERNFGHGRETLSSLLAMFNMIAFLIRSALDIERDGWQAARAKLAASYRLLDHMKFLACCVVHGDWDEVMQTIVTGELPTRPP